MSAPTQSIKSGVGPRAAWRPWLMRSLPLRFAVVLICLLWSIPTLGLLISSFRPAQAITTTGWWNALLNPLAVGQWTLNNYSQVIDGQGMGDAFINSLIVTLPSTLIPITIAAFAAYAFAWIRFPFRGLLFAIVVGLLVVPIQMTLIPVLQRYSEFGLNGTFLGIWLAHTGFGLPLAIFLLYNYISQLPRDLFESAAIDGASHFQVFTSIVVPLSIPAIGAFAIFQFLWVWNDLLVALVFLGVNADLRVLPTALYQLCWQPRRSVACPHRGRVRDDDRAADRLPRPAALIRTRDPGRLRQVMTAERLMAAFAGTVLPGDVSAAIGVRPYAGVSLFRAVNVELPGQVRLLTAQIQAAAPQARRPLLIAIDQEGGQLNGLGEGPTPFAGPMAHGAAADTGLTERVARAMGIEMNAMGVNLDYAPTCDLATSPENPALGIRSFGDDPAAVGELAAAFVRGLQSAGVAATVKHFPGMGEGAVDTHHGLAVLPASREQFETRELVPFRAAIAAGARLAMTGHASAPALSGDAGLPSSLAPEIVGDLLRRRLGLRRPDDHRCARHARARPGRRAGRRHHQRRARRAGPAAGNARSDQAGAHRRGPQPGRAARLAARRLRRARPGTPGRAAGVAAWVRAARISTLSAAPSTLAWPPSLPRAR